MTARKDKDVSASGEELERESCPKTVHLSGGVKFKFTPMCFFSSPGGLEAPLKSTQKMTIATKYIEQQQKHRTQWFKLLSPTSKDVGHQKFLICPKHWTISTLFKEWLVKRWFQMFLQLYSSRFSVCLQHFWRHHFFLHSLWTLWIEILQCWVLTTMHHVSLGNKHVLFSLLYNTRQIVLI